MGFENEPSHSDQLITHDEQPFNAEPPLTKLLQHPITPTELIYSRNHGPVIDASEDQWKLKIDGLVEKSLEFTVAELKEKFPKIEVVAALQCAGNRRKTMQDKKNMPVEGLLWGEGTICNVRWGGVRLRDLLEAAKVLKEGTLKNLHVCFASSASKCENEDWYGGSVPLSKVMDPRGGTLLAYELNGVPLLPDHGYPLRAVIPGFSGARWVKWLDHISVSERESTNYYQQKDYKVLPPHVETREMADSEEWWSKLPSIQENTLNSVIGEMHVQDSKLYIKGYAVGGAYSQILTVEVSIDEGRNWTPAQITYQEGKWSWTLWESTFVLPPDIQHGTVYSRAVCERGNVQPSEVDWNLRGVAYSAFGEKQF